MNTSNTKLVLVHQKTGQRYPLEGDFVIGRSNGHLVFDHDPKLSGKHCLIRQIQSGFAIYDLKSRTGISVNGTHLPAEKSCLLRVGALITVGDQTFAIEEASSIEAFSENSTTKPKLLVAASALILLTELIFGHALSSRSEDSNVSPRVSHVDKTQTKSPNPATRYPASNESADKNIPQ